MNQSDVEQKKRNKKSIEGYRQSDLKVRFNHEIEQLYPSIDIDDG